jgi:hypothetical protein
VCEPLRRSPTCYQDVSSTDQWALPRELEACPASIDQSNFLLDNVIRWTRVTVVDTDTDPVLERPYRLRNRQAFPGSRKQVVDYSRRDSIRGPRLVMRSFDRAPRESRTRTERKATNMPHQSPSDAGINLAILDADLVTHTSADQPAEKSKRASQIAGHVEGRDATAHTPDLTARKK